MQEIAATVDAHRAAFTKIGIPTVFERCVAVVAQPGIGFSHFSIIQFDEHKYKEENEISINMPEILFEAHSVDYQTDESHNDALKQRLCDTKNRTRDDLCYERHCTKWTKC